MFTERQLAGLRALRNYTRGTFDPWFLAGGSKARERQYVLSMLNDGAKVTRAQSGVTAIRARLFELFHITEGEGGCLAGQMDCMAEKAAAAIGRPT